jgi:hypothetical protein
LDRWRVVTSGQNISFSDSNNTRTVTAPAGGVEQVIEGLNILSDTYTINWTGTATATVNGTSRAKGASFSLTGGSNCTVRFSSGTFSLPQLEVGTRATPFERRSFGQELALCQRYYEILSPISVMLPWGSGTQIVRVSSAFSVTKRSIPSITMGTKDAGTGTMGSAAVNQYGVTYFGSGSFQDVIIYSGNTANIEL